MDDLVALFKALADPTRLRLAALIVDRARCGQDWPPSWPSTGTVSHHLRVLREVGLCARPGGLPSASSSSTSGLQQALKRCPRRRCKIAGDESRSSEAQGPAHLLRRPRLSPPAQRRRSRWCSRRSCASAPQNYEERELSRSSGYLRGLLHGAPRVDHGRLHGPRRRHLPTHRPRPRNHRALTPVERRGSSGAACAGGTAASRARGAPVMRRAPRWKVK